MYYRTLAQQYFEQYQLISAYVKELRHQAKSTEGGGSRELHRRISILYKICLELKHTSEYLIKCEKREDKNAN